MLFSVVAAFQVPTVDVSTLNGEGSLVARHALATTGALAVTAPGIAAARAKLNQVDERCLEYTATSVGRMTSTGANCDLDELRAAVDFASKTLFSALRVPGVVMEPNYTFEEVMDKGDHLEHVHLYVADSELDEHVDAGLLISMVSGDGDARLKLALPSGTVECEWDLDSVLFLVGQGAQSWLGLDLRPAPHSVAVRGRRAWYGKMWLPPADALVQGLPFKEHRQKMRTPEDHGDLGCGGGARMLSSAAPELCTTQEGDEGILCWAQCVSVEALDCEPTQTACVDYDSGVVVDGSIHCASHSFSDCGPQCLVETDDNQTGTFDFRDDSGFCIGDGVTMYMDGFRSVFEDNAPLCVNFWMTTWTLDSKARFVVGVIGAFFVGAFVELLTRLRKELHKRRQRQDRSHYKAAALMLHFTQAVFGYLAMFVAMTYSVELFFAVCLGATLGHLALNFEDVPTSTDPCCAASSTDVASSKVDVKEECGCCDDP